MSRYATATAVCTAATRHELSEQIFQWCMHEFYDCTDKTCRSIIRATWAEGIPVVRWEMLIYQRMLLAYHAARTQRTG